VYRVCAALVDSRLGVNFFFSLLNSRLLWAAGVVGGQTGLSVCCVLLVSVYFFPCLESVSGLTRRCLCVMSLLLMCFFSLSWLSLV
jgi:hypothetical protein